MKICEAKICLSPEKNPYLPQVTVWVWPCRLCAACQITHTIRTRTSVWFSARSSLQRSRTRHLPLGHLSSRVHGVHPYDASALAAVTTDITLHDINQLRLYRTVHIHASTSVHPLHHLPTSKIHRRKAAVSFAAHAPRSILSRNRHRTPSLCRALPHERNVPSLPSPPSSSLSAARFPPSFRLSLSFLLLPSRCHT